MNVKYDFVDFTCKIVEYGRIEFGFLEIRPDIRAPSVVLTGSLPGDVFCVGRL